MTLADPLTRVPVTADIEKIRSHVYALLSALPASLTYHNPEHTIDVTRQCMLIAKEEGIEDIRTLLLLQVSGLYHDTGFVKSRVNHEEISCQLAKEQLPAFNLCTEDITCICEIIMATKMPQTPVTSLHKIICDADLDYLGRTDYLFINAALFKELCFFNDAGKWEDWELSRIEFLRSHSYFTKSAQSRRNVQKLKNLQYLTNRIGKSGRAMLP